MVFRKPHRTRRSSIRFRQGGWPLEKRTFRVLLRTQHVTSPCLPHIAACGATGGRLCWWRSRKICPDVDKRHSASCLVMLTGGLYGTDGQTGRLLAMSAQTRGRRDIQSPFGVRLYGVSTEATPKHSLRRNSLQRVGGRAWLTLSFSARWPETTERARAGRGLRPRVFFRGHSHEDFPHVDQRTRCGIEGAGQPQRRGSLKI